MTIYKEGVNMNRLKELRNKAGLSQNKLVSSFNNYLAKNNIKGITAATYSRWENSNNSPTEAMWNNLADYFNVSTSYLKGIPNKQFILKSANEIIILELEKSVFYMTNNHFLKNDSNKAILILLEMLKELGYNIQAILANAFLVFKKRNEEKLKDFDYLERLNQLRYLFFKYFFPEEIK